MFGYFFRPHLVFNFAFSGLVQVFKVVGIVFFGFCWVFDLFTFFCVSCVFLSVASFGVFLASHMVLGLILAFSCNFFSLSSILFVSASSFRFLSIFLALQVFFFFFAILFPSLPDLHAVWNLSRMSFFIFRASLISLLLVLWGLSVLILYIPTVFFSISLIDFSASLYVPVIILFLFSSSWMGFF